MPRANTTQTNFTSGEISPLMYGRVDVTKYFNGARSLTNMIVLPQGGAFRRPGTTQMGFSYPGTGTTTITNLSVLRKFVPSTSNAFILEFTDTKLRFWNKNGLAASGLIITTPYLASELPYICIAESVDVAYITCPNHPVYKLSYDGTTFTFAQVAFNDGPYLDVDTSDNRIKLSLVSDITTLVSNTSYTSANAVASSAIFASGDVGKYVEYIKAKDKNGNITWGLALVTAFTNSTHDVVTVQSNIISPAPTVNITFSSGSVHSSTFTFNTQSVGKFIRLTASQAWYLITGFTGTTQCTATAVSIVTYNTSTVTVSIEVGFVSGDVGKYIDYKLNGQWGLAVILTQISNTNVTVDVIDQVLVPPTGVTINVASGANNTTSSSSGVFTPQCVGKYVRDTNSQAWGKITAVNSTGDKCTATVLTMFTYTYPTTIMTLLDDRVITVQVDSRDDLFDPTSDIGLSYRFKFGAQWRSVQSTIITSTKSLTGVMSDYLPWDDSDATNPYNGGFADQYRLPAWSSANGYPEVCSFHGLRAWFANSPLQQTTAWSSETNDFESMTPSDEKTGNVLDTNSMTITIADSEISPIRWIRSGPVLLLGTEGGEYQIRPNSLLQALSPTNFLCVPQSSEGSIHTQTNAMRIGSQTLFIQKGGLRIREMEYEFQSDSFQSRDISVMSEHILRGAYNPLQFTNIKNGATHMDYGNNPITIVWLLLNDGTIAGITYDKDQEVVAFHHHKIGASGGTTAFVESLAVIPNADGSSDVVWLSVKRTINGRTVRSIENFMVIQTYDTKSAPQYLDCTVFSFSLGNPLTIITGLDNLGVGSVIDLVTDGMWQGQVTVANVTGGVGFDATGLGMVATSYVVGGFQAAAYIELLDPEGGSPAGTSQGKRKRTVKTTIRVNNCPHMQVGTTAGSTNAEETVSGQGSATSMVYTDIVQIPATTIPPFYTGDISLTTDDGFNGGGRLALLQNRPYPMNIIAVFNQVDTND